MIILQIILCVFIADFLSGLFHWLVDAYSPQNNPFIKRHMTDPVILHHTNPRAFTKNSWLKSAWLPMIVAAVILVGAYLLGWHNWMVACTLFLGINGQELHKWSHRTKKENGPIITFLQKIRFIQTPRHHAAHHRKPNDCAYCTITNVLNPILDRIYF